MIREVDPRTIPLPPMLDWCGLHQEYLNPGEMGLIIGLLNRVKARTMVEIGCRDGRTAKVLLNNVPSLEYYLGVDVPMDYRPGLRVQVREMVVDPGCYALDDERFELLIKPRGSLDLKELPYSDAIFVDGDHSYKVVMHDSIMALEAVTRTGIVIWHDYTSRHLDDVTDALNKLSETWEIQHITGTWLAFYQR
jgi:predicted O-methyltransferase YrrM